jgi:hypothetical protein
LAQEKKNETDDDDDDEVTKCGERKFDDGQ